MPPAPDSGSPTTPVKMTTTMTTTPTKRTITVEPLDFVLGGLATMGAALFSNPFEVVKTRMQLEGELQKRAPGTKRVYANVPQAFGTIVRNEGLLAIQKGLAPALVFQFSMNSVRFGMFSVLSTNVVTTDNEALRVGGTFVCGMISGAVGGFTGCPPYLVKTRLQAQSSSVATQSIGIQHGYKGMMDGFRSIVRAEGTSGLFTGARAIMSRVAIGSGFQLSGYTTIKRTLLANGAFDDPKSVSLHFTASLLSSVATTAFMNPVDVLTSRIMNARPGTYTGLIDCLTRTVKTEGLSALMKGIGPHWLRIGPHTICTFIFWEALRKAAGLESSGGEKKESAGPASPLRPIPIREHETSEGTSE